MKSRLPSFLARQRWVLPLAMAVFSASYPSLANESTQIKIEGGDIRALVDLVSKSTGRNFIVDPAVNAEVTFISGSGITKDELYATFISILQVHGLVAIETGNVTKIVPMNRALQNVAPIVQERTPLPSNRKLNPIPPNTSATEQPQLDPSNLPLPPSMAGANLDFGAYPLPTTPDKLALIPPQTSIPALEIDPSLPAGLLTPDERLSSDPKALARLPPDEIVTQVIRLQYVPAATANATLIPLAGQGDTRVQMNQTSNALIVTGRVQNVERIIQLAQSIDKPNNDDFELITLKYALANKVAQTLQQLIGAGVTLAEGGIIQNNSVRISADERTNSVLISGDRAARERLRTAIIRLDIPRQEIGGTQIIRLTYADAQEMAQTLQGISQGVQQQKAGVAEGSAGALLGAGNQVTIIPDRNTNSLVVTAPIYLYPNIRNVIAQLDVKQKPKGGTRVVKLRFANSDELAQILQGITQGVQQNAAGTAEGAAQALTGQASNVSIASDRNTNSIIVTAPDYLYTNIVQVIKQLDVQQKPKGGTRVVPLKFANAEELAQTLQGITQGVQQNAVGAVEGAAAKAIATQADAITIVPDRNTNALIVTAPEYIYPNIQRVIAQLDVKQKPKGGTVVIPLRYAKAEDLVKVLQGVSPTLQQQTKGTAEVAQGGAGAVASSGGDAVSVLADKATNSLIITAPEFMQANLRRVIAELDKRRGQVMIEAIIAEVSTDLAHRLGVSLAARPDSNNGGAIGLSNFGNGLGQAFALSQNTSAGLGAGLLFGLGKVLGGTQFGLIANALKGDAATNILATPTLVTLDNEEAKIVVGQEVPFVTGSYSNTGGGTTPTNPFNTIERRDVGLSLIVTPQINRGKTINLKIDQEVSNLASTSVSASDVITNKRKITTNVMVEDGQILILGGLIEDSFRDSKEKVPVLGDLPIIGGAFRGTNTTKLKQNLMVFIHPIILPDGEAADAYTRNKYQTLRQIQADSQVLQRGRTDQRATPLPPLQQGQNLRSVDQLHQALPRAPAPPRSRPIIVEPYQPTPTYAPQAKSRSSDDKN